MELLSDNEVEDNFVASLLTLSEQENCLLSTLLTYLCVPLIFHKLNETLFDSFFLHQSTLVFVLLYKIKCLDCVRKYII